MDPKPQDEQPIELPEEDEFVIDEDDDVLDDSEEDELLREMGL